MAVDIGQRCTVRVKLQSVPNAPAIDHFWLRHARISNHGVDRIISINSTGAMTENTTQTSWQLHTATGYAEDMHERCADLLSEIKADDGRRRAVLTNPKALHRELFARYAPVDSPEYAGNYRGTPETSLVDRAVVARSQIAPGQTYAFLPANEVPARMERLLSQIADMSPELDSHNKQRALAYAFSWFGYIHPFLDGNGHVQRALFAAMATEFGIPLTPRFVIHPRPYDQLMAIALELFAIGNEKDVALHLIGEHLSFFLGGFFEQPLSDFD
jgi:fido (protein-threonine AMPylation protein)